MQSKYLLKHKKILYGYASQVYGGNKAKATEKKNERKITFWFFGNDSSTAINDTLFIVCYRIAASAQNQTKKKMLFEKIKRSTHIVAHTYPHETQSNQ